MSHIYYKSCHACTTCVWFEMRAVRYFLLFFCVYTTSIYAQGCIWWVISHAFDESCHTHIMSHVTHIWRVMLRMYYLCLIQDTCCAFFLFIFFVYTTSIYAQGYIWWVISHAFNESCHTYMTSHVTHVLPVLENTVTRDTCCALFFVIIFF